MASGSPPYGFSKKATSQLSLKKKNRIKILKNKDFTQNSVKASKNGSK